MQRRDFLKTAGVGVTVGAASVSTTAWGQQGPIRWRMVTAWPKGFPGVGAAADNLAKLINEMSGGAIEVHVYAAGELVPALEVFDAVGRGGAELGHGTAHYWRDKVEAATFFYTFPFGLTAQEMNGWLYRGGGLDLWKEIYEPFGVLPLAAGNTGMQMGGWFNREIKTVEDLKDLKMRIHGAGADVLKRAGGLPVNLPGGEIVAALKSGALDAAEWLGPYNDLAFGLHKAARFYYYPGWQDPGPAAECLVNKKALESLPKPLQAIVVNAAKIANQDMLADYTAQNAAALRTLAKEHKVNLKRFPDEVLIKLREWSGQVALEIAGKDAASQRVYESYNRFREQAIAWQDFAERAYLNARALPLPPPSPQPKPPDTAAGKGTP